MVEFVPRPPLPVERTGERRAYWIPGEAGCVEGRRSDRVFLAEMRRGLVPMAVRAARCVLTSMYCWSWLGAESPRCAVAAREVVSACRMSSDCSRARSAGASVQLMRVEFVKGVRISVPMPVPVLSARNTRLPAPVLTMCPGGVPKAPSPTLNVAERRLSVSVAEVFHTIRTLNEDDASPSALGQPAGDVPVHACQRSCRWI